MLVPEVSFPLVQGSIDYPDRVRSALASISKSSWLISLGSPSIPHPAQKLIFVKIFFQRVFHHILEFWLPRNFGSKFCSKFTRMKKWDERLRSTLKLRISVHASVLFKLILLLSWKIIKRLVFQVYLCVQLVKSDHFLEKLKKIAFLKRGSFTVLVRVHPLEGMTS